MLGIAVYGLFVGVGSVHADFFKWEVLVSPEGWGTPHVTLPVTGAGEVYKTGSGWSSAGNPIVQFDVDPIRTTRIRFLQDAGGGPPAHPNQARLQELEAYPSATGPDPWPAVWTRTSSGTGKERLADGVTRDAGWESADEPEEHSAQVVFGFPGNGRRLAFIFFSIFMLISSVVCFLAKKHAGKDADRVMESLTMVEKKPD